MVKRRFLDVRGRRVHYRRAGSGPPLVMLHGSPGNSEMLAHEMAAAAGHFTVFALDTPGFGSSDALPGEVLEIADLARATAEAMETLRLPPCLIYGTHSGALIATEVGARHPERVSGVIAEGLPIFTDEEIDMIFRDYFAPMKPDPLGSHLTATWVRFRDQHTWFPWTARDNARLNPIDRPTPEGIHHWVMMFYRSCKSYMPAYRAVCHYGERARDAADALDKPAVYLASEEDMLFPHLDRLPPMKPGQSVVRLNYDPTAKFAAIVAAALSLPRPGEATVALALPPAGSNPAVQFIDTGDGQTFIRCYGDRGAPALILLHDAPGSGLLHQDLARELAAERFVILPDLPGCGESDDPPGSVLEAGAQAISVIADVLELSSYTLAAIGCGAAVAALVGDVRATEVLIQDPPVHDEATAAAIAPDLRLTPEGSHWLKAWLMVRDGQVYRPWFDGRVQAQRSDSGNFDAQWLHDQTFEIMKARASYFRLPREACAADTQAALARQSFSVTTAGPDGLAALFASRRTV